MQSQLIMQRQSCEHPTAMSVIIKPNQMTPTFAIVIILLFPKQTIITKATVRTKQVQNGFYLQLLIRTKNTDWLWFFSWHLWILLKIFHIWLRGRFHFTFWHHLNVSRWKKRHWKYGKEVYWRSGSASHNRGMTSGCSWRKRHSDHGD
jgi:hypothetical protein